MLEIGCGTGDFAAWMATSGAHSVVAIDPSAMAIAEACSKYDIPNLIFVTGQVGVGHWEESKNKYDIVVMVGVLEHVRDPSEVVNIISTHFLAPNGVLATSSPNFLNPRGFMWLALQELAGAVMSLTDKHMISPRAMKEMAGKAGLTNVGEISCDYSWASGARMIEDFKKRLPLALPDTPPEKIARLIKILEYDLDDAPTRHGANTVYFFQKVKSSEK